MSNVTPIKAPEPTALDKFLEEVMGKLVVRVTAEGDTVVLSNMANVMTVLQHHPETRDCFARNLFTGEDFVMFPIPGTIEANSPETFEPRPLVDGDYLAVQVWLQMSLKWFAMIGKATVIDAIDACCPVNAFDPLLQWAERCAKDWDGVERVHRLFDDYFVAKHPSQYTTELGEVMMMALVLRILYPGAHQRIVPVLQGPQGIGKSTGLTSLSPRAEWFSDDLPPLSSKDVKDHVRRHWLIELGEMEPARKSEVEELKAFLTRTQETFREAYGRKERTYPRRCAFVGTTNNDEYLRDTSGNDRFYPVELVRVDVEAIKSDRDQLIGEAVDLLRDELKHGHKWWELSDKARPQLEEKRSEAEVAHPWHGTIAKAVEGLDEVCAGMLLDEGFFVPGRDGELERRRGVGKPLQSQTPNDGRVVGAILRKLGWEKNGRMPHDSKWPRTTQYTPAGSR